MNPSFVFTPPGYVRPHVAFSAWKRFRYHPQHYILILMQGGSGMAQAVCSLASPRHQKRHFELAAQRDQIGSGTVVLFFFFLRAIQSCGCERC